MFVMPNLIEMVPFEIGLQPNCMVAEWNHSGARFKLYADGKGFDKFLAHVAQFGPPDQLQFLGPQKQKPEPPKKQAAKITLQPQPARPQPAPIIKTSPLAGHLKRNKPKESAS